MGQYFECRKCHREIDLEPVCPDCGTEAALRARVAALEEAIRGLDLESDECNCTEDRRCNRCRALDALHNL